MGMAGHQVILHMGPQLLQGYGISVCDWRNLSHF